jgi:hypothetical protein
MRISVVKMGQPPRHLIKLRIVSMLIMICVAHPQFRNQEHLDSGADAERVTGPFGEAIIAEQVFKTSNFLPSKSSTKTNFLIISFISSFLI